MELYAVAKGDIPKDDWETFRQIISVVDKAPDMTFGQTLFSCHHFCRVLAEILGPKVAVRDGYFARLYEHSWLISQSGSSLIDAYPVAGGSPFVIAMNQYSPWSEFYCESNRFADKLETQEFKQQCSTAVLTIRRSIQEPNF